MKNTVKEKLQQRNALSDLEVGMKFIAEEVEIAKRGEFGTETDIDYLAYGLKLIKRFKKELNRLLNEK